MSLIRIIYTLKGQSDILQFVKAIKNNICINIYQDCGSSGNPLVNIHLFFAFFQKAEMKEPELELAGSDSYAARFGESIANLGDIDNDGFKGINEHL